MKSTYSYRERDYTFGNLCLTLRTAIGITQGELAQLLGVTGRAIQTWEGGSSYPKVDRLKRFIELCVQHRAFAVGREEEEIRKLWQAARQRVLLDETWLASLLDAPYPDVISVPTGQSTATGAASLRAALHTSSAAAFPRIDWVGALDVSSFRGRDVELAELSQWVLQEHCRLIAILGMGGVGKSALISRLGQQIAGHFDAVLWRSVRDAPPCQELVADCITFCSETPPAEFPSSLEQRIDQLVGRLQEQRCLLVFDNLETLLQEGDPEGNYLPGYKGYERLIGRLAESTHRSCVVLTSREKPREIVPLEGSHSRVRSMRLSGLDEAVARALLSDKELVGEEEVWRQLIATYAGNPLALKIMAETIAEIFGGDIAQFLQSGELIFNGVRAVLRQQVERLSPLERVLLTWLAVLREWVSQDTLLQFVIPRVARGRALEALEGLRRRSLVERGQHAIFTLHSVVMEYVTDELVQDLGTEIVMEKMRQLRRYSLEQAQAKDYVRQTQVRLLVQPLLERLHAELGQDRLVEEHLLHLLDLLRTEDATIQGYGPANVISLLKALRGELRGLDLSHLSIRGAHLQGVQLQDATLEGAQLHDVVWTSAFDAVISVAVSSDGRFWAAGSNGGEVRVWREEGRTPHLVLRAHTDRVGSVTFSPDGRTLATASWDGTIKLWDLASSTTTRTLQGHDMAVTSIDFSPDGRLVVSSSYDGTMRIWDVRNGSVLRTIQTHQGPVLTVTWSPDGRLLASGGFDQTIRLWDAGEGTLLHELHGHHGYVTDVTFAPGATLLASCSFDSTVKLWEVKTCACLRTFAGHTGAVSTVAWSPDGRTLASCGYDTTVRLWDQESGECRFILQGHSGLVLSLTFTPGGEMLLSGSHDQTLRVWESASGQCLRIIQGYAMSLFAVAWSPDSVHLVDGSSDANLTLWNLRDRTAVQVLRGHTQCVNGVAWSPDGSRLASSSDDQTVRTWDVQTGACVRIFQGHANLVNGIAWHPNGSLLASGSTDQTVRVWDIQEGVSRWTGSEHTGTVTSVAWHPHGTLLASGSEDHTLVVWQGERGSVLLRLHGHEGPIYDIAWSPDGSRLASCGGSGRRGELLVWDAQRGTRVQVLEGHSCPVFSVAWSLEGSLLVSGGTDGMLHWWDMEQGVSLDTVQAHKGWIHSLRVSPDGEMVASTGEDGEIKLWELYSHRHLATLRRDRPYERLTITGTTGLSEAQKMTLQSLGAVE